MVCKPAITDDSTEFWGVRSMEDFEYVCIDLDDLRQRRTRVGAGLGLEVGRRRGLDWAGGRICR